MRAINGINGSAWVFPDTAVHVWDGAEVYVASTSLGSITPPMFFDLKIEYITSDNVVKFTDTIKSPVVGGGVTFHIPIQVKYLDFWKRIIDIEESHVKLTVLNGATEVATADFTPYIYGDGADEGSSDVIPVVFWNEDGIDNPTGALNGQRISIASGALGQPDGLDYVRLQENRTAIMLANGFDLNNLEVTGFFMGEGLVNVPFAGWFFIECITHDDSNWRTQRATSFGSPDANTTGYVYIRTNRNGTWTPWRLVVDSNNFASQAVATTSANGLMSSADKTKLNRMSGGKVTVSATQPTGAQLGDIWIKP